LYFTLYSPNTLWEGEMAKKDLVLFLVLSIVLLFIFSPAFSKLQEFLFGEKSFKQWVNQQRKNYNRYWDEQHEFKMYLEKEIPKE
jgi:putative exporter of polyketide antibiotics